MGIIRGFNPVTKEQLKNEITASLTRIKEKKIDAVMENDKLSVEDRALVVKEILDHNRYTMHLLNSCNLDRIVAVLQNGFLQVPTDESQK